MEKQLEKYFKFSQFRAGQKEIVESILAGHDVVALMPTGGGKSLCFQLPAVLHEKITVVISPLIALMKDQVDSLNARGIAATFINSSLDSFELDRRMKEIREGKIKLVYLAPERLANASFQKMFATLDVFLLAIDEAHCVSQWGHDFRPDYLEIRRHIRNMKNRPVVAAFTATATPEVKDDIIERLEMKKPKVFVRGFDRPNLKFFVQANLKPKERLFELLRIAKSISGPGIVYTLSRKEAEIIAKFLTKSGLKAAAYHAGMTAEKRTQIQDEFMENRFKVIVATVAFGMGVDKADIRFVIHSGMPGSLEGYYQEAGRAGRDGEKAFCILLHGKRDSTMHKYFIRMDRSNMQALGKNWNEIEPLLDVKYDRLAKIEEYVQNSACRRKMILEYFGDPELETMEKNCQGCDVCLNWKGAPKKSDFATRERKAPRSADELSGTVEESVKLYQQKFTPSQIAKMRNLGVSTIFNHLVDWYASGGDFKIDEFLTSQEEADILRAIKIEGAYQKIGPLKKHLPDVSYEQIRMAIAKMMRK